MEVLPGGSIEAEFEMWKEKCLNMEEEDRPETIVEALDLCNSQILPNIYCLLKIFITMPVTSCTAERTFSSLKFLKNYLRSTTREDRMSSLAMIYIHKDLIIDIENIIDRFSVKNRRLNFV